MDRRIKDLQESITDHKIDGILITNQFNWRYLSGFTGSNATLVITTQNKYLVTDFRYLEQAAQECPGFEIIRVSVLMEDTVVELLTKLGLKRIGFEEDHLTYRNYLAYQTKLSGIELVPLHQVVEKLRGIKDEREIAALRKAAAITDQAFSHILNLIKPGVKESDLALELEYYMKKEGSEKPAFDTIIASGFRAALPHGLASDKEIQSGEMVIFDFGAVFDGYHADMTRTVFVGTADRQQEEIYKLVQKAQKAAVEAVKPGIKCSEVDHIARNIIALKGYGPNFGHGLGHSVGLEIHEKPAFTPKDDTVLEPGMVLTVEPGIYLSEWGGVRIEDLLLVTSTGCEILSKSTKEKVSL